MNDYKLVKYLYLFDKYSKIKNYEEFFDYKNMIRLDNIDNNSDNAFDEYKYKKYDDILIKHIVYIKQNLNYLKQIGVLEYAGVGADKSSYYINKRECKEYLNPINTIIRFLNKYKPIRIFLYGLIVGIIPFILKILKLI